jgi:hypothetical protein
MHGGNNPGPPKGSQNALKHGLRSAAAVAARKKRAAAARWLKVGMAKLALYSALEDRAQAGKLTAGEAAEMAELSAWLMQPVEWDGNG